MWCARRPSIHFDVRQSARRCRSSRTGREDRAACNRWWLVTLSRDAVKPTMLFGWNGATWTGATRRRRTKVPITVVARSCSEDTSNGLAWILFFGFFLFFFFLPDRDTDYANTCRRRRGKRRSRGGGGGRSEETKEKRDRARMIHHPRRSCVISVWSIIR